MAKVAAIPHEGRSIRDYPLAGGAAFREGAAVVLAAGVLGECGADPLIILGFALHAAGAGPATSRCLVAKAKAGATFWMQGTRAPLATDVGVAYGIAKDGDGDWCVDATDTTATRLMTEAVDLTRNLWLVSILPANRQIA
jgi:hypothetical protein